VEFNKKTVLFYGVQARLFSNVLGSGKRTLFRRNADEKNAVKKHKSRIEDEKQTDW